MSKIEEIISEFADLNLQIIRDIKKRGYSHADEDTLATVRENILAINAIKVNINVPAQEESATKTGD